MSDAARLTKLAFSGKSAGTPYTNFNLSTAEIHSISNQLESDMVDNAYAAIVSYAEAMLGITRGSSSWSIIRLYYSAFYCLKAMMFSQSIVPFNSGGGEMLFDLSNNKFYKGGTSSHVLNWKSLRSTSLKNCWCFSQDSQEAYALLRTFREDANYIHAFEDPNLHNCLVTKNSTLSKRFRAYRDDNHFLYTYLQDHLAIAYPTKLIFEVDLEIAKRNCQLDLERAQHAQKIWNFQDRCPVAS
ncbi:hypothetical protein [Gluconobacter cerinus]|uniref:hypothetical protein n=1 Tax=Gluconobacter cerinus TaxID=38307 RepID=UPI001B8D0369|nr:hypothetical protein [Gluconobacter cerinus]MBS1068842.1 hypothetical protein [Gluconobacter cerinus]